MKIQPGDLTHVVSLTRWNSLWQGLLDPFVCIETQLFQQASASIAAGSAIVFYDHCEDRFSLPICRLKLMYRTPSDDIRPGGKCDTSVSRTFSVVLNVD
jgi:hypothetical protein